MLQKRMALSRTTVFTLHILYNVHLSLTHFLCSLAKVIFFVLFCSSTSLHGKQKSRRFIPTLQKNTAKKTKRQKIIDNKNCFFEASGGSFRGGNQSKVPSVIILPFGTKYLPKKRYSNQLSSFRQTLGERIQKRCESLNRIHHQNV